MMDFGISIGLGEGGITAWSPNTSGTPAAMWLRADNVALGSVATWTDLTPNNNSPTNSGTKPIATAASGPKASQPAVLWTGSETLTSIATALIGTKNFTLVTVAKFSSIAAGHVIVNSGSNANGFLMGGNVNASSQRDFNANGNTAVSDTTNNATTNWEAWIFESDASGNLTLSVNNVTHTLSPANATGVSPTAQFSVGSLGTGTAVMVGAIWEVIVFTTKLGATDRASLVTYLSGETGLF